MKKLRHIFLGWGKALGFLPVSTAEEKLSALRLRICKECDFAKSKKILMMINGDMESVGSLVCTRCHCPCVEKTIVVDEECPLLRW